MHNILKFTAFVTLGLLSGFAVGMGVMHSITKSQQAPSLEEMSLYAADNVATSLPIADQRTVKKSRLSAVRVLSLSEDQQTFSAASGTYFTSLGRHFILTVNHGIMGPCALTKIEVGDNFVACVQYIELNSGVDYAIIEVEEIENRVPIKIPQDLPKGKRPFSLMNTTYYTGFPNNAGPFTIRGSIIGYFNDDFIYLQSYGWAGSSGAGVFAQNGDLIGHVLAIDIGYTEYGVDVLEDVILVVPVTRVNWASIRR